MQQELQATALARLLPLLHQLPAAEAVAAASAVVRLQGGAQAQSADAGAVAVLSAVLTQLCQQQQVAGLPGQAVGSLLWCCKATGWVPPAAVHSELLAAANARLLQLRPHQQLKLLQAVAAASAAAAAGGVLSQQLQRQQLHLMQGIVEQLHTHLQQYASAVDWDLRHPASAAATGSSRGTAGVSAPHSSQQAGFGPRDLVSMAGACKSLPLPLGQQLLQQVLDVWQLLQQQGAVPTRQALLMVYHLSDLLPESPARPWHKAALQYEPQQYQHNPQHFPEQPKLLPQLLQQAVAAVAAELSAGRPTRQQSAQTLGLLLRVCAKLRFQLPPQLLAPVLQQLQAALPGMTQPDIVAVLVAVAQSAVPAHGLVSAALSELSARQQSQQQGVSTRSAAHQQEQQQVDQQVEQQQQQQPPRRISWQSRPPAESAALLWAILCSAAAQDAAGVTSSSLVRRSHVRWLTKLAHAATDITGEQLLQDPQLLLLHQQVWDMLRGLPHFQPVRRNLLACGLEPPKPLLPQQLKQLTQLLLLPSATPGLSQQQALLQLLFASEQQQRALLQQRMLAAHQAQAGEMSPSQQQQAWQALARQACVLTGLLPLWLQHQLQKQCQRRLAAELVTAQRAAGCAPSDVRLRVLSSGEVVLLLQPSTQQQESSVSTDAPLPGKLTSGSCRGVAVVLETPSDCAVNNGSKQLGPALARAALLRAEGYRVVSLPLQLWLPDFVQVHQQEQQLQQYRELPGKFQHVQKLVWKRGRRERTARARHLQHLLDALQQLQ
jgi:hypothetical protein